MGHPGTRWACLPPKPVWIIPPPRTMSRLSWRGIAPNDSPGADSESMGVEGNPRLRPLTPAREVQAGRQWCGPAGLSSPRLGAARCRGLRGLDTMPYYTNDNDPSICANGHGHSHRHCTRHLDRHRDDPGPCPTSARRSLCSRTPGPGARADPNSRPSLLPTALRRGVWNPRVPTQARGPGRGRGHRYLPAAAAVTGFRTFGAGGHGKVKDRRTGPPNRAGVAHDRRGVRSAPDLRSKTNRRVYAVGDAAGRSCSIRILPAITPDRRAALRVSGTAGEARRRISMGPPYTHPESPRVGRDRGPRAQCEARLPSTVVPARLCRQTTAPRAEGPDEGLLNRHGGRGNAPIGASVAGKIAVE